VALSGVVGGGLGAGEAVAAVANPRLDVPCGQLLNITLAIDHSTSIDQFERPQLDEAVEALARELGETNDIVTALTFSTGVTNRGSFDMLNPNSVDSLIAAAESTDDYDNGTNWEGAL